MTQGKEKFIIIDGNALLHRAFHALPPTMTLKDGTLVNAVYGFTSILLKIIKELKPTYICAAFDRKGKTKRAEEYKEYKAQRVKQPDELYTQIPIIEEVLAAFNIPVIDSAEAGYEADDVIGTIIKKNQKDYPYVHNIIVTGDMDTLQLVNHNTNVFTMRKGLSDTVTYDENAVKDRYGLKPTQLIDYKALRGDPSDNIPGVKGIGEKTAAELIQQFGSLENLYKNIESDDIKPRIKELLKTQKAEALMSKKLVTIQTDLKTNYKLADTKLTGIQTKKVFDLLVKLEFKSLLNKIPNELSGGPDINNVRTDFKSVPTADAKNNEKSDRPASPSKQGQMDFMKLDDRDKSDFDYQLINSDSRFEKFFKQLEKQKVFAVDTETTSLNPWEAKLVGISISWKADEAYFIANPKKDWLKKIKPILEDSKIKKYGHNLKFDFEILMNEDIFMQGLEFDTLLAGYLLTSGSRNLGLDDMVFSELGHKMQPIEELIGPKGKDQLTMDQVPVEKVSWYACEDADFSLKLAKKLKPELEKIGDNGLLKNMEMPLIPVLAKMEQTGIKIDEDFLNKLNHKLSGKIKTLEEKIYKLAGAEFNIASPLQLKEILFDKLQISTQGLKKTKTGISTAAFELEKMWDLHPIIPLVSQFREFSKLQNTYTKTLPKIADKNGRIHTSFNQTVAATGRLSSSDPNLQNIPIRTEIGKEIRKGFVAERGKKLISADYSQIELRVIASLSADQKMIATFKKGEDIHSRTAAEINKTPLDQVTKEQRRAAKEVNFGVIYGLGSTGLAQRTGITRAEAKEFIAKYFATYPQVKEWLDGTKEKAAEVGYVETLLGRRRYLPEINSGVQMIKASAERMAVNAPIQGTAADILKLAMIKIDKELAEKFPKTKMLLTVHDELVFECPDDDVEKVSQLIKETMENIYTLKVPIKVEIGVAKNWGECK